MRVLFVHGLMSSPRGTKAVYFAERFEARTPAMNVGDFMGCVAQQAAEISAFQPNVVIGSSFGAAVTLTLLNQGLWKGPTLLLAQAAVKLDESARLPDGVPVLLVHGTRDEVVPIEHSRQLARTGSAPWVRLVEVDDDHRLTGLVESDRLADLVREAHALGQAEA